MPASSKQRLADSASRSIFTPSSSRRSALPVVEETARLPCFAMGTSSEASTSAETVEILNVERSEEHTSELQSRENLVCRLLLEKKKNYPHCIVKLRYCISTE